MGPFDFLNSINSSKEDLMDDLDHQAEKQYLPFMVNRGLSYFPDTVLIANEMNARSFLDNKLQYDFLRLLIRKRKRFSKWHKKDEDDRVKVVKDYYGYSQAKAEQALHLLTDEDIAAMRKELYKGGMTK